ncbi:MAG: UDP-N-acetyl-D-glucosamine/UDP-N-acetyl-D-galactosamine dehydrogenase [Sphingomonadales bacterium]|jgi:UDP-N-acetyl-D-galactosamine dehydrogenase|nr:UDP-N-acetyl-D-glucosamine/UDP-N-acetyl-D-galactosamine dehydrogenase [Sphingomonadales bacterium]MEA3043392.1 UDP-N-acetyl-D-glucosamine/UDP-N-acetyl-D-galactosamine dehydrogenase [Sphingomonadales bacterium]MEA3048098.1 UDP-N-acetyl-D-glucosamine/UDP-N-acetyl-D-galactosamine dehydrogenase [Sphingomonadales bacterium]
MHFADQPRIAVVGLGYVGLPLAVALARHFETIGFDIDSARVAELARGHDRTREVEPAELAASALAITDERERARGADIYIVTAPTPVDQANRPDLSPLCAATESVAGLIDPARPAIIVYESTVYPGVTEDICGPLIARVSGLERGRHFFLAYSPERVNPGDREHSIDKIMKVVAGENDAVTARVAALYDRVTSGGTFRAKSIRTAEAAKVIENAQRDINIAFMNEITQIFGKLGLSALDVLEAAGTKWNFLRFHPGLVGGHCIGVDPYYLSHCAQSLGHLPRVILAGRAINDGMGGWIADQIHSRRESRTGDVLMLGLTFKPDVPDLRNSKVVDVVRRLTWLGHRVTIHDPLADPGAALREHALQIEPDALARRYDVVVAAVPHLAYRAMDMAAVAALGRPGALIADLHGLWRDCALPEGLDRWTL